MRNVLWISALSLGLLCACAGPEVTTERDGGEAASERHLPRNDAERLAVDAVRMRGEAARGGWIARFAGDEGTAARATLTRSSGSEEDAPLDVFDLTVRDGWIERVDGPRYVARTKELEEAMELVARRAAAAPSGQAVILMRNGALSGRKTDLRCMVEVRGVSPERRELFSRTINVCP